MKGTRIVAIALALLGAAPLGAHAAAGDRPGRVHTLSAMAYGGKWTADVMMAGVQYSAAVSPGWELGGSATFQVAGNAAFDADVALQVRLRPFKLGAHGDGFVGVAFSIGFTAHFLTAQPEPLFVEPALGFEYRCRGGPVLLIEVGGMLHATSEGGLPVGRLALGYTF